jgi:hypothetical protein
MLRAAILTAAVTVKFTIVADTVKIQGYITDIKPHFEQGIKSLLSLFKTVFH